MLLALLARSCPTGIFMPCLSAMSGGSLPQVPRPWSSALGWNPRRRANGNAAALPMRSTGPEVCEHIWVKMPHGHPQTSGIAWLTKCANTSRLRRLLRPNTAIEYRLVPEVCERI